MDLTYTPPLPAAPPAASLRGKRVGDTYLLALSVLLAGYALISRSAAYVGVPPLFVGEVLLALGAVVALRFGRWGPLWSTPATWILTALLGLTVARTVPYVGTYGLDAARDAMQIGYGVYAFVVAALLMARPERLLDVLTRYRTFVVVTLSTVWALYLVYKVAGQSLPALPWAPGVKIFEVKGGDVMVHLCGIAVFLFTGLKQRTPLWTVLLAFNAAIIMVSNRGGMVAFFLGCGVAWLLRPPEARVGGLVYAFILLVAVGLIVGPTVSVQGGGRTISVEQIVTNVKSIFGHGGEHLDGTKKWRLDWWTKIYEYTVEGPYFWTGKGFGINLAKSDGFRAVEDLRSPHNGHMTILARTGVPGLALWVALQLSWLAAVLRQWLRARAAKRSRWMAAFAFLTAYWVALHVNASFDVFFEGPMGGIWFWTVFGTGLAAAWIHAHRPDVLDPLVLSAPGTRPAPAPSWSWTAPAGFAGDGAQAAPPIPTPPSPNVSW